LWIDGWTRGWVEHDAELVASLYAEDAVFRTHPFRDPHVGPAGAREYASWAFESEEPGPEVRFGEPRPSGRGAVVEYWAIVRSEAREQTIAGVALLRFNANGLVREQRDYWAIEDGRLDPHENWGT
jgi:ketosteroid isomerase-like protein